MNDVIEIFNKNYYSRWLSTEELLENGKEIKVYNDTNNIISSGLPIGDINGKYIVDTSVSHNLVITL